MGSEESIIYLENLNILVVGKPNVGKRALIYSIFNYKFDKKGDSCVINNNLIKYTREKTHITLYETPGYPSNPRERQKFDKFIHFFINKQMQLEDIDQQIHFIWYLIDSKSCKIDEYEKQFISEFSKDIPIIIVLTKSDDEDTIFKTMLAIESSNLNISRIVPVLSENTQLYNSFGFDNLIYYTVKALPNNIKPACNNHYNIVNQIEDVYDEERLTNHVNILLTGQVGVGKSTLINSVFNHNYTEEGIGDSITNQINEFTPKDSVITLIDTPGLCLDAKKRKDIQKQIFNKINEKNDEISIEKKIHCIWYCVDCQKCRFEKEDLEFINQYKNIPVIIVLTQSYFEKEKNDMINLIKSFKLKKIYPVISKPKVLGMKTYQPCGIEELLDKTKHISNYRDPTLEEEQKKAGVDIKKKEN